MDLEVVSIRLEMIDGLLPVSCEDLARRASETLVDLEKWLEVSIGARC